MAVGSGRVQAVVVALVVAVLGGCSSGESDASGETNVTGSWTADCERVMDIEVPVGAPVLAVVADATASGRGLQGAPGVGEVLTSAQAGGLALVVVAVDGPGAVPAVVGPVALDPEPGSDSVVAQRARGIALGCAQALLSRPLLAPKVPGSDVLAAIGAAVRQKPAAMLVLSDGVGTGSSVDPAVIGWQTDVATVVGQLRQAGVPVPAAGTPVTWVGVAETATPLPEQARVGLAALWTALLSSDGAEVAVDTRTGSTSVRDVSALPEDTVTAPQAVQVVTEQASCLSVPSLLMFAPDSVELTTTDPLAPVVSAVTQNPGWVVHVDGHAADFGTPEGQRRISQGRADAVKAALTAAGVPGEVVDAVGHGSSRSAAQEWPQGPGGAHDLAAAEMNRRVEVRYGTPDAVAAVQC